MPGSASNCGQTVPMPTLRYSTAYEKSTNCVLGVNFMMFCSQAGIVSSQFMPPASLHRGYGTLEVFVAGLLATGDGLMCDAK